MPKSLVLGNGNMLIGLDNYGQVKDFYFPHVGQENQTSGNLTHKIGVWVEDKFSWIDDGSWVIDIDYQPETLASKIKASNNDLKLSLDFIDVVYNETNIFIREITVTNSENKKRSVRLFFNQQFKIHESQRGDTAYYDPLSNTVIHYKGKRAFVINCTVGNKGFHDYTTGLHGIEGKEGTFKDAEDGLLSKNAIEHGFVDSTIGIHLDLEPNESYLLHYWITAADFLKDAKILNDYVLKKTPQHLIKTTQDFWKAWVNKREFNLETLPKKVQDLFKKSLLIIRTHTDNQGAVIASCDSDMLQFGRDNYTYMWPRDGALVASALDKAGDEYLSTKFYQFCNEVISEEGYFMHKYWSDKSLGSSWHPWIRDGKPELPIQEDETALVIYSLWQHYELAKDLEFIESIYNSLIKKGADFMVSYRDEKTKLPKPSYDLWEAKFGTSTFSSSAVYGALIAASKFAELLGKLDSKEIYLKAAEEIKEAILKYLYNPDSGIFYKMVNFDKSEVEIDATLDISSVYGIYKFGVLEPDDPKVKKAIEISEEKLTVKTEVGGVARFTGDVYFRTEENGENQGYDTDVIPGNPWFITSLWIAQYYILRAKNEKDLEKATRWFDWCTKYANKAGILSEQLQPYTGQQLSTAPLTWSHAEFVSTVIQYLDKTQEMNSKIP